MYVCICMCIRKCKYLVFVVIIEEGRGGIGKRMEREGRGG